MHKYNLREAGLLTQVNTDGVVTDADTGDKAFDKDLSYAVIIDDPDYGVAGKFTQSLGSLSGGYELHPFGRKS